MTLGGKTRGFLIIFVLINVVLAAFWVEVSYLASEEFLSVEDSPVISPKFWFIGIGSMAGLSATAIILYYAIVRTLVAPLDNLVNEAERLANGTSVVMRSINRHDEIGRLATAFNRLAGETAEARANIQGRIDPALADSWKNQRESAVAERLTAIGRLAANIASRINDNVVVVRDALKCLRKDELAPEERTRCLIRCEDGLICFQGIVRDIFDIAKERSRIGPTSVTDAVLRALDMVRGLAEKSRVSVVEGIEASARVGEEKLTTVADAGDLLHVFVNLLINAIDAMPRGGVLTVRVSRVLKWVIVEIVDTGVGLTLDELSASFDFYQSTKSGGDDVGLGLSVAHHIVTNYGGALTLNSRKGEGTKATVELPAADAPVPRGESAGVAGPKDPRALIF